MSLTIEVTAIVADEGTVVIAEGITEEGKVVRFAGDQRPMQDIAAALADGDEQVFVVIDEWQLLGRVN